MSTKPSVEERFAIEDAVLAYLAAVDGMDDVEALVDCFTSDATLDLTGLNLGLYQGSDGIRGFFAPVFENMTHHLHTMTNFRIVEYAGDDARIHAYICGMGRSKDGTMIQVYVYYDLQLRRTDRGWKISRFYEAPMLPMPDSVGRVHATH